MGHDFCFTFQPGYIQIVIFTEHDLCITFLYIPTWLYSNIHLTVGKKGSR